MTTSWDRIVVEAIEQQKQQLEDVLVAYRQFREKLDALPPEVAKKIDAALAAEQDKTPHPIPPNPGEEFKGKSSLECARIILTESGNAPTHYTDIAKIMMHRGYRARKNEGTSVEVSARVKQSLWSALSKAEDEFQKYGSGYYTLKNGPPFGKATAASAHTS